MRLTYILFIVSVCVFTSCGDDPVNCTDFIAPVNFDPNIEADNIKTIEEYLVANGLTAEKTENNLYYIINEPGGAAKPNQCSSVLASYKGYLPDGTVFDMSSEEGIVFELAGVIKGWQEGMPLYGLNGSGTLLIPSKLGYGNSPPPGSGIPENSVLIFDITVLGF